MGGVKAPGDFDPVLGRKRKGDMKSDFFFLRGV